MHTFKNCICWNKQSSAFCLYPHCTCPKWLSLTRHLVKQSWNILNAHTWPCLHQCWVALRMNDQCKYIFTYLLVFKIFKCFGSNHVHTTHWNILNHVVIVFFGCDYKDKSQKPCRIVVKIVNFFTYVLKHILKLC